MKDYLVQQNRDAYSKENHEIWKMLCKRQKEILKERAFDLYLDCIDALDINEHELPDFKYINELLHSKTGWEILPVKGYIPPEDFFYFLAQKKFPSTTFIRTMEQLDYLQEPDIFHDIFGHIPLLANPVFADYMHIFGQKGFEGLKKGYIDYITRLYWFTVEFGLIQSPKGLRIYGSGILSSKGESIYCLEEQGLARLPFDVTRIMRTWFRIDEYQKLYFVIPDLETLFNAIQTDLQKHYDEAQKLGDIPDYKLIPGDVVISSNPIGSVDYRQLRFQQ